MKSSSLFRKTGSRAYRYWNDPKAFTKAKAAVDRKRSAGTRSENDLLQRIPFKVRASAGAGWERENLNVD